MPTARRRAAPRNATGPAAALLAGLERRWALRILLALRGGRLLGFGELGDACPGISPSVLAQRLAELRREGLVVRAPDGRYATSAPARGLEEALARLDTFARRFARRRRRRGGQVR